MTSKQRPEGNEAGNPVGTQGLRWGGGGEGAAGNISGRGNSNSLSWALLRGFAWDLPVSRAGVCLCVCVCVCVCVCTGSIPGWGGPHMLCDMAKKKKEVLASLPSQPSGHRDGECRWQSSAWQKCEAAGEQNRVFSGSTEWSLSPAPFNSSGHNFLLGTPCW